MAVRVLTQVARPGVRLASPVIMPDGKVLLGRGTVLAARHLAVLHDLGVKVVEVEDDGRLGAWEIAPQTDAWLAALDARFLPVSHDRRMVALRDAVKDVYLDYLRRSEGR
jgi:hypothetical protein